MEFKGRGLFGILAGVSAAILFSLSVHTAAADGPKEGGGSSADKAREVVVEEVLERQRTHVPLPKRVRRPSDSDLVSRMEFFDREEIIRARQRILDFEKAAQEAIARGEEPPEFWQPYNPAVDRQDLGDSVPPGAGAVRRERSWSTGSSEQPVALPPPRGGRRRGCVQQRRDPHRATEFARAVHRRVVAGAGRHRSPLGLHGGCGVRPRRGDGQQGIGVLSPGRNGGRGPHRLRGVVGRRPSAQRSVRSEDRLRQP
jgi:hypothetical protein